MSDKNKKATAETSKGATLPGVKLGDVLGQSEAIDYISPRDLSGYERFTIFGAKSDVRNVDGKERDEIRFNVAVQTAEGVKKYTLTLSLNDERMGIMSLVLQHKALTNCRIDYVTYGNNRSYWKIVDADTPRPTLPPPTGASAAAHIPEDDIPF